MINALIVDLITTSEQRIRDARVNSIDDVRNSVALIRFSDTMYADATLLKRFLREILYRHYQVNRMTSKARRIVSELFDAFMREPTLLAPHYQIPSDDPAQQARKVADYIAGMTDRYAMREHRRLFMVDEI
jgi:dGTPase